MTAMTIFEMSLGGGLLIAVILVLRRVLLYQVPKWTFLLLWAAALCRLLVPFALPSPISVYTGADWVAQTMETARVSSPEAPPPVPVPSPTTIPGPLAGLDWTAPEPEAAESFPPVAALCLTGEALSALFFGAAYLWNLRRFWDAVPAEGELIRHWQETHPTLLPVQIKVSRAARAPLAYGLLQPVILLPANTCCSDEEHLIYILTHEYVHIRRGDMVWKLLLAAALCVHWFNPLVWAMYFCANRDLELACDEAVVRTLGLDRRKDYAYALLSAAERGFFPLCAPYTTQDHMEERIRAIMKIKRTSFGTILTAILLVTGITAVFATSRAPVPENLDQPVQTHDTSPSASMAADGDTCADGIGDTSGEEEFAWPLPQEYQKISNPAGQRVHPATGEVTDHLGIDIAAPKGTAVYAAKSGVVTRSEMDSGLTYGNLVEISHSDGSSTLYAHMSERAVEAGQSVEQGEMIGCVGATGRVTGSVLHFEISKDGSHIDPEDIF